MRTSSGIFFNLLASLFFITLLSGCPSTPKPASGNEYAKDSLQKITDTVIENAMQKKAAYEKELKSMTTEQLFSQLSVESARGLEPFNSLAYAEAVSRGKENADKVVAQIKDPSKASLLALLAVRKVDPEIYLKAAPALRISILTDALKNTTLYNVFGLPHIKWEDAANTIIAEDGSITDSLTALLRDTSAAPVWGSEDYMEYTKYHYRVCDYALALLMSIQKQVFTMPVDLKERDRLIATLLQSKKG